MRLRITKWREYQHYKDRCPPWIKLHVKMMQSRSWVSASDSERVLAIACMLIASQDSANDGSFDADEDYFQRVAYLNKRPNFKPLIDNGFLVPLADASTLLANDAECLTRDRDRDRDRDREEKESNARPSLEEVTAYCQERQNQVDPQKWFDHYTSNGWMVGRGNRMKDWRAAVRTWEKNNFDSSRDRQADQRRAMASIGRQEMDTSGNHSLMELVKQGKAWQ